MTLRVRLKVVENKKSMAQHHLSKQTKIFMICAEYLDGKNAQTTHVLEVFKNLAELFDTYLFAPKLKNLPNIHHENNIIFIPTIPASVFRHIIFEIFLCFNMIYCCIKYKPDVIYVRHTIVLYSYILLSKVFKIPYILEINGLPVEQFKIFCHNAGSIRTIAINIFTKINEKLSYKYAKKIIVVTPDIKKYIVTNYNIDPNRISVIQNGANTDLFKPASKHEVRKELGLDKKYNYIGFSGSFVRWHGLEELVKSALQILKKNKNVKFLLVGNGATRKRICHLVNNLHLTNSFIFIDIVPYAEVPKYVNSFDIGIILKYKNIPGSPLKLWEYMACGIPIIATDSEDFKVIEECHCGILVNPEKTEKIANAILTLLGNEKLRREMGENGRKYVVKHHSWKIVAKRIERVINEALGK